VQLAQKRQVGAIVSVVIVSCAVAGYFTGLQSPMNPADIESGPLSPTAPPVLHPVDSQTIPATRYPGMPKATYRLAENWRSRLNDIPPANLLTPVAIRPGDKQRALEARSRNRAFNGAPPTIPHPVEHLAAGSCVACHASGAKTASLRIPAMSHAYLTNCTQCHVESNPRHMQAALFRDNSFEGLPAPAAGHRAYPGAPPQMPHTTWMRNNCTSCHGPSGLNGLRTTHPWRRNCTQCHAPPAESHQLLFAAEPQFLPGPQIRSTEED